MRNFVVKNDFNRSSIHKDKKNDYDRAEEKEVIKEELEEVDVDNNQSSMEDE